MGACQCVERSSDNGQLITAKNVKKAADYKQDTYEGIAETKDNFLSVRTTRQFNGDLNTPKEKAYEKETPLEDDGKQIIKFRH